MRPLKLTMNNFGPFIKEQIDFTQITNNQLFLISGKTGSGKTMIFDAMVYALFGEASTKDRDKGDLRSHFADRNEALKIAFEFKLGTEIFRVERQGKFTKEGNKSETPGHLTVYRKTNSDYELIESTIKDGNKFIKERLGVNADQFRQLFILPQGEFKKFLVSSSLEKQQILRTLFNSQRFEVIQNTLKENVDQVRQQIDDLYRKLQDNWDDVNDFNDEDLQALKNIDANQTKRIVEAIKSFEHRANDILTQLFHNKNEHEKTLNQHLKIFEEQKTLSQNYKKLSEHENQYNKLLERKDEIAKIKQYLNEINEVKLLSQYIKQHKSVSKKISDSQMKIDEAKNKSKLQDKRIQEYEEKLNSLEEQSDYYKHIEAFLTENKLFFKNIDSYQQAYKNIDELNEKITNLKNEQNEVNVNLEELALNIKDKELNYEIINDFNDDIYQLKDQERLVTQEIEENSQRENLIDILSNEKKHLEEVNKKLEEDFKHMQTNLLNLDFDNYEKLVSTLQQQVTIGDTCPICGNEVTDLSEHIDIDQMKEDQFKQEQIAKQLSELQEKKGKLLNSIDNMNQELPKLAQSNKTMEDVQSLKSKRENLEARLKKQKQHNQFVEKQKEEQEKLVNKQRKIETDLLNFKHQFKSEETKINDFETTTEYTDIEQFKESYQSHQSDLEQYSEQFNDTKDHVKEEKQQLELTQNNIKYLNDTFENLQQEKQELDEQISNEMTRVGFETQQEIDEAVDKTKYQTRYEQQVESYEKEKQSLEGIIQNLKEDLKDKKQLDLIEVEETYQKSKQQFNEIVEKYNHHTYKVEFNNQKFKEIKAIVNQLDNELQNQTEMIQLSDVITGKNATKLKLENYVLIHYLTQILSQANKRLSSMTGERYQLVRKQSVSQGYSGLEINVFDAHSNKERHVSTLSGGETFQASLALALGLSEVVQQESGGIALESIFIDEGFGTLDQETLDTALDTLINLQSTGRLVGIISHVSELKQRIPLILQVTSSQRESYTKLIKQ
ncbi:exonuclease subunit SbcC [Staphylococcus pettenkoferi]|uniref:exonuclease subunit SbcC n=1 Tax=Staphylococcus pettenkoferi TaxID=170573 RepID=UPI0022732049|nr:exonuclease subunit SbcC [Staphylococcus pettenkoferi]MCY1592237.1 SMC family ATPase [Staphylococcus pettenkoferi]MCY1611229.1 SMC family ATPase [Staphylococcus pettenkoferi]MCY1625248.1 SMC family ATPase [Staphylococcus pettenkoferi]